MEQTTDPEVKARLAIKIERLTRAKESLQGAAMPAYAASAREEQESQ